MLPLSASLQNTSISLFVCVCVCVCESLRHVRLFVTPWTITCQVFLSMEFSRQEYWSELPFASPGDLPDPRLKPRSPEFQADSLLAVLPRSSFVYTMQSSWKSLIQSLWKSLIQRMFVFSEDRGQKTASEPTQGIFLLIHFRRLCLGIL